MAKLSIIVPVYNVEKYLNRCVDSLIEQTFKNIEIILVDDGSSDLSASLCDDYSSKYDFIHTIHQENQGLGPARNTGLKYASGEYVAFVDSDDWVDNTMYEYMINCIEINDCDIATCGKKIVTDNCILTTVYQLDAGIKVTNLEAIRHFLLQDVLNMSACDKVFKKSLFSNITFPGNHYVSEDIVPIFNAIENSKYVYITGVPFYNYYYRPGSLSKSKFSNRSLGMINYSEEVFNIVSSKYFDYIMEAYCFKIDFLFSTWRLLRKDRYNGYEKKMIYAKIKKNKSKILQNKYLTFKHKFYYFLIKIRLDRLFDVIYLSYKMRKERKKDAKGI